MVALLINDFGRVNIDAMEFRAKSPSLVELTNGSIFCSCLKEEFIDSLATLLGYEKDLILIEGSGLADPSNMNDVLKLLAGETQRQFRFLGSVCILDGQYFLKEVRAMESVVRQVAHSQLALLNKIDLIDESTLDLVRAKALTINPGITIIETTFGRAASSEVLRELKGKQDSTQLEESLNTPENRPLTLVASFTDVNDTQELRELLLTLVPHTNRMKGFVLIGRQLYKAESVQDTVEIRLVNRSGGESGAFVLFLRNGLASLRAIQQLKLPKIRFQL
jgi:G3E family GTPase